ncbi:MAG: hypothetical protein WAT22_08235 [Saprospiraceae bacterium]|jgi:hypothetical protein|nr:hypothetical protein [Saprospiraceae bacterium]MBP6446490.1 hypothetical protein [Saprospiraceae bacterium]
MDFDNKNIWTIKGATLSDKSVKDEYGLTQDEIVLAINTGKFQYRINYIFENPYFKLIRTEIKQYISEKYGDKYLQKHKLKTELEQINKNLRTIKNQTKTLEKRKNELQIHLNNLEMQSNSKSKV